MRAFAFLAAALLVQQPAPPDSAASVIIRSTTTLVQVRVAAQDSQGRPIDGLRKEDFEIQDDRKVQPIVAFSAVRGAARANIANRSARTTAQPATSAPGHTLLVLDWLNSAFADRISAQAAVLKVLKNLSPSQKLGLYVISSDPGLRVDFTSDASILAEIVSNLDLDFTDPGITERGRAPSTPASREMLIFDWNNRVRNSLSALDRIAAMLSRAPEPRSLLWISAGFPVMIDASVIPGVRGVETSHRQDFEKWIARLTRAGIAVYTVDSRGLSVSARGFGDTLIETAERTGGTAFYARNDLDTGIRLALEDQQDGYTLAFRVPSGAHLGVHELRVHVAHPGVRLRYRESYQLLDSVR